MTDYSSLFDVSRISDPNVRSMVLSSANLWAQTPDGQFILNNAINVYGASFSKIYFVDAQNGCGSANTRPFFESVLFGQRMYSIVTINPLDFGSNGVQLD